MAEIGRYTYFGARWLTPWRLQLPSGQIRNVVATGLCVGPFFLGVIFTPKNSIESGRERANG